MSLLNLFYHARRSILIPIIFTILGVPALLSAQEQSFQISDRSTANMFLGTPENPESFYVGAARITGEVRIDSGNVSNSHFDFTISAASPNAPIASGDHYLNGKQSVITFHSEDVKQRGNQTLEVRGQLTVTQTFRPVATAIGKDYPITGPETETSFQTSHEATFIFSGVPGPNSAGGPGDFQVLSVTTNTLESGTVLSATAKVNGEAFPEVVLSIQDVAWPVTANDQTCGTLSGAREDDNTAGCAGAKDEVSAVPAMFAQSGAEQAGLWQSLPAGDQVTMRLNLILADTTINSIGRQPQPKSTEQPHEAQ